MIVLCGWLSDVQRKGARRWKRKNYVHFIQHIRRPRPRPTAHCNVEATLAFPLRSTSESTHYRVNYLGKTSDVGRAKDCNRRPRNSGYVHITFELRGLKPKADAAATGFGSGVDFQLTFRAHCGLLTTTPSLQSNVCIEEVYNCVWLQVE